MTHRDNNTHIYCTGCACDVVAPGESKTETVSVAFSSHYWPFEKKTDELKNHNKNNNQLT